MEWSSIQEGSQGWNLSPLLENIYLNEMSLTRFQRRPVHSVCRRHCASQSKRALERLLESGIYVRAHPKSWKAGNRRRGGSTHTVAANMAMTKERLVAFDSHSLSVGARQLLKAPDTRAVCFVL